MRAILQAGVLLGYAIVALAQSGQGPFGFERGMTRDRVIELVGQGSVDEKSSKEDILLVKTAPKPHPAFEFYVLVVSATEGVLKIRAVGAAIQTNGFGQEVQSQFKEILGGVSSVYGKPTLAYDFLSSGSLWTEAQYWMMGLLKSERHLNAYWLSKKTHPDKGTVDLPNDISIISLGAEADSSEKGHIVLGYEFEGWESYNSAKKAKQNKVF